MELARLDAYLQGAIAGYAGPSSLKQFSAGRSNPTFLVETPRRRYVLRRRPEGKLLKSAHAVDREFRVQSALKDSGVPVPRALVLCEDESVIGSAFYVMEHVEGRLFLDSTLPDVSREERAAIFDSVNATLARLHMLDVEALGLADFGRPGNYFARQISRWSAQYAASRTEDIPEMDRLIAWLPGAVPAEERARVVHGDFSFHNVLIHPREPRVAAVLDWELSTLGEPLGDLYYHAMEWYRPAGVDPRGCLNAVDRAALGIPDLDEYVARYCERTGRAVPASAAFHRAYNLFRVAAIIQGIVGRARDGTAPREHASMAERVRPLAVAAWQEAREAGAR